MAQHFVTCVSENHTTPPKKRSSCGCLFTVRAPDTKSTTPRGFEHPHLGHPAILDSMVQTPFSLLLMGMILVSIEKVWISATLENQALVDIEGYATATEEGIALLVLLQ